MLLEKLSLREVAGDNFDLIKKRNTLIEKTGH